MNGIFSTFKCLTYSSFSLLFFLSCEKDKHVRTYRLPKIEAKPIADEVSQNDQFVANVRGRALAMLAYIAFKENNSNLAKAYIEQFNSLDFKLTLEDLMFGLWNLKSNQEFIQDYRKVVADLGVN